MEALRDRVRTNRQIGKQAYWWGLLIAALVVAGVAMFVAPALRSSPTEDALNRGRGIKKHSSGKLKNTARRVREAAGEVQADGKEMIESVEKKVKKKAASVEKKVRKAVESAAGSVAND